MARSLNEALATHRIGHHNVIRVFDLACESDGMVWQTMELLDGQSVADLLQRYGKLSPLYALDIAMEVAWGLHAAHDQQIIHRDVQPSNVFVTAAGRVKVLDFSLAKVIPSGLRTTHGKTAIGTAAYMAPEHVKGGPATPQFDVYALGMMTWQMLAGRHPFDGCLGNMMRMVQKQLHEDPESLVSAAGLPGYCDEVVRGATAKDALRRYVGMWPLATALRDLRARLEADPAMDLLVRHPPLWERQRPILRDPDGWTQYGAPRSLPRESPAPQLPSARVVVPLAPVAPLVPPVPAAPPPVAATVPMPAVSNVPPPSARLALAPPSPATVALPVTMRPERPAPPSRRWVWAVCIGAPALAALIVGLWLLASGLADDPPGSPAAGSSGKAPATATSPRPRRPAPPQKR